MLVLIASIIALAPLKLPYVARDACPFECCQYGRWVARSPLRVHPEAHDRRHVSFTLAAGDSFQALSGDVWVDRPGKIRVRRAMPLNGGKDRARQGSTLLLLDQLGEGGWRAWCDERIVMTNEDDWIRGDSLVRLERWPEFEWWVHIRSHDGRTGWILLDDAHAEGDLPVDGADGCG